MSKPAHLLTVFRNFYGSHPLHLLTMLSGFALLGYVVVMAKPSMLWKPEGAWWPSMVVWFAAAFLVHDLVLFPIYALADRLLGIADQRRRRQARVPARNYLRVPTLGTGLLFLIFFPGIIRQGAVLYHEDTGLTQQPFLGRWLMLTAVMFAASALVYATRLAMSYRHHATSTKSGSGDDRPDN
jgi:hypothetical protein